MRLTQQQIRRAIIAGSAALWTGTAGLLVAQFAGRPVSPRMIAAQSALMLGAAVSSVASLLNWREDREESLLRLGYAIGAGSGPQERPPRTVVPFPLPSEDPVNGDGTRIRA